MTFFKKEHQSYFHNHFARLHAALGILRNSEFTPICKIQLYSIN